MSMYSLDEPCGILNVFKPQGLTSRDVVNVIQRMIRPVRCGHAGTLDPLATGVLLVCIGQATRLISLLQELPKQYKSEFILGQSSDTDDVTGQITLHDLMVSPTDEQITEVLNSMIGTIQQTPPAYSAVHVDGKRAYDLARQGLTPELKPRDVQISSISVHLIEWPRLQLTIDCGSGTYIRSIARDLGRELRCGGLMSQLERTRIGQFRVEDAVSLDALREFGLSPYLHNPRTATGILPQFQCTDADLERLICGKRLCPTTQQPISPPLNPSTQAMSADWRDMVALLRESDGALVGIAEPKAPGELQPRIVFLKR
ncbi:MAG: tRNA pseudouridine(55) synthase TruB [Planctomyces sp.]|nr:tRNA pseudouridine(55) synthase TruB [Planctomyces sp.]